MAYRASISAWVLLRDGSRSIMTPATAAGARHFLAGMKRDDVDIAPPRKSIMSLVVPAGSVAIVVVNSLFVGLAFGRKDEQLANVVDAVKEIKSEMYRRSDAEVLNVKLESLDKRVTTLETARQQHVDRVTAKVEKQEDDILSRAQHWLIGGKK